jgi:glycosyltransferase involved in cell wall biosynthesis
MPRLLYVLNIFRTAAVPNVLLDISTHIRKKYEMSILSLERINNNDGLVQKCRRLGLALDCLNAHRLNVHRTATRLKGYLSGHRPDLIHSHLGRADILCALCKGLDTKLITTFHNIRSSYSLLSQWGYRLTDRIPDLRISVSETVQRSWYDEWVLSGRHRVVYNAVDAQRLQCPTDRKDLRAHYGIDNDDFLLLNIGRLTKQKGQHVLVEAMKILVQQNRRIKLIICGWGKLEKQLQKNIKAYNLQRNVKLAGYVQDIAGLFKAADVFVATPLFEGHSVAVLEAMASKTPIVCTDEESLIELLDPEGNALIVKKNSITETSDAVLRMLEKQSLRQKQAESAYSKYEANYTPEITAKNYLAAYDELLSVR